MRIKKNKVLAIASVIFTGTIGAASLYWQGYWKPVLNLQGASSAVLCRARLYVQKAQGGVPELSWIELWRLTLPGMGFNCGEGRSLGASLQYSSIASESERRDGARIFRERCARCHGADGSNG